MQPKIKQKLPGLKQVLKDEQISDSKSEKTEAQHMDRWLDPKGIKVEAIKAQKPSYFEQNYHMMCRIEFTSQV